MKKLNCILLSLIIMLSNFMVFTVTASAQSYVAGDLSGDAVLDIIDVVVARAHIVGNKLLNYEIAIIGDLNSDDVLDIVDVVIMRKTIVGFPLDEDYPEDTDTEIYIDPNNEFQNKGYYIWNDTRALIDNAQLSPHYDYYIYEGTKAEGKVFQHIILNSSDIATLKAFANAHFCEQNTVSEKMYVAHQWIHYNNDYAYVGEKWNTIESKTYVDAIFNYRLGQCIQYNGAMAAMLAYQGFNVWMEGIPGVHWTTYVEINGTTYHVECGNYGKNGEWQDFFSTDLALR